MDDDPNEQPAVPSEAGRDEAGRDKSGRDEEPSSLLSRLRVIEDQPIETRAAALSQLHDQLRAQLESGDAARPHA